ncbi:hypothetical protein MK805_12670 [Shimazuella sp. AN120528]|uniref:hypothetical protein n=1 Tax=Shimazuella soli TaxID=1892854 RepID=UPI001F0FB667|nr:hypothetical protein [Shimazuella soli]MCH5585796.1 hypothetical protein [Shimazuella soli]
MRKMFIFAVFFSVVCLFSFYGETWAAEKVVYDKLVTYTSYYNTSSFKVTKNEAIHVYLSCSNAKNHIQSGYLQHFNGNKWVAVDSTKIYCNAGSFFLDAKSKGGWYRVRVTEPKPPVKTHMTIYATSKK